MFVCWSVCCGSAKHYLGMEILCCQLRISTSPTLSPSPWRESVSNSDLSVPAPPTGQSDSGSTSSPIAIVISPASPASKPPRNQTSQGGFILFACPWRDLTQNAHSSSLLIRALIWLGLTVAHSLTQLFLIIYFFHLPGIVTKSVLSKTPTCFLGMHVALSIIWFSSFLSRCNDCLDVY